MRRNSRHFSIKKLTIQKLNLLKQLGFNEKEAEVYLSLLELGEATIKNIADNSVIPRTSLYTPIKTLTNKGVVEFYKRKGRNYYVAIAPEKLLRLEQNKIKLLEDNIVYLNTKRATNLPKPKIKFYEGKEGIKILLDEILDEKRPFSAITCIEYMNEVARDYFDDFIQKRIEQRLVVNLLTNKSEASQKLKNTDASEFRETRFVPQKYTFNTANYIFGNKIAILSLKQKPIVGILVEDENVAQTHKMYFDLIWKMASSK